MEYVYVYAGVLSMVLRFLHGDGASGAGLLSYDFYDKSCPQLESIVREGVGAVSFADPSTPAALLRLLFHDCQVQGCDASILVDPDGMRRQHSEMASSKNFGIAKRYVIGMIKSRIEQVCPRKVSCADILVLAAREAIALSGGPRMSIPLGRRDSSTPTNYSLADASLPPADIGVDGTLKLFREKGMTVEETVAILGAHTLGVTHCYNLQSRLYGNSGGNNVNNVNAWRRGRGRGRGSSFVYMLKLMCPNHKSGIGIGGLKRMMMSMHVKNDMTWVIFDKQYFVESMNGGGVLRVDAEMGVDSRTGPFVRRFAADQDAFFHAFSRAFLKLAASGVLTGNRGVIRTTCNSL